jgi:DNA-binding NtrC family response regulator
MTRTNRDRVRILVADDDPAMLESMASILTRQGYEVVTARNGEAALKVFRKAPHRIQMVISDGIMPGLSGIKVLQAVTALSPSTATLLITGSPGMLFSAGEAALAKPFRADVLAAKVQDLLDTRGSDGKCSLPTAKNPAHNPR